MFEAKLVKASLLKKIVDAIKDIIESAPFDIRNDALSLQAMDTSHVALVSLRLGRDLFEEFRCDRNVNIGLSMKNVAIALKCAGNDDTCMIRFDESGENTNILFSFLDEKSRRKQDITLKLMDIENENLGVPDQKYAAVVDMPASEFHRVVNDLSGFSDSICIKATKGQIQFEAVGGEHGGNLVTYNSEQEVDEDEDMSDDGKKKKKDMSVKITSTEDVKLGFSVKYLTQFAKATKLSERVRLSISNQSPIVVEYPIENDGTLKFYLAPKIEEDEMD